MTAPHAQAFRDWLGIDRAAGVMLAELYAAKFLTVRHEYLMTRMGVGLSRLRRAAYDLHEAMERGSLVAESGVGYRLTETGLSECEAAIRDAEREDVA